MNDHFKKALICGVSGQDGSYLARLLIDKGYEVWGTSRDDQASSFYNHKILGIEKKVKIITMFPEDFRSVLIALKKSRPTEVYYLSGQSSVGLSFEQPAETIESIVTGTLNLLEVSRLLDFETKIYFAGSSECFGDISNDAANEETPFKPRSPYAVAKSSAFWLVQNYREAYNLKVCTGLLFNHESPLRPDRFVTKKIIQTAIRISLGSKERLELGRLDISRDWGWSPEYVDAMWRMVQLKKPTDFVIATGESNSLEKFVETAFNMLNLDWKDHVDQNEKLMRPTDILMSRADPSKAKKLLNWEATYKMQNVISEMLKSSKKFYVDDNKGLS